MVAPKESKNSIKIFVAKFGITTRQPPSGEAALRTPYTHAGIATISAVACLCAPVRVRTQLGAGG